MRALCFTTLTSLTLGLQAQEQDSLSLGNLGEVEVSRALPAVRREGQRIIYDLRAFPKSTERASVVELLRALPSIQLDESEGFRLDGTTRLRVHLDGRRLGLVGEELLAYLRSLSTSEVERIELIRNPGASYRGARFPIVNIVRKPQALSKGMRGYSSVGLALLRHPHFSLSTRVTHEAPQATSYLSYNLVHRSQKESLEIGSERERLETKPEVLHQLGVGSSLKLHRHQLSWDALANLEQERLSGSLGYSGRARSYRLEGNLSHSYSGKKLTTRVSLEAYYASSSNEQTLPELKPIALDESTFLAKLTHKAEWSIRPNASLYTGGELQGLRTHVGVLDTEHTHRLRDFSVEGYLGLRYRLGRLEVDPSLRLLYQYYRVDRLGAVPEVLYRYSQWTVYPSIALRYSFKGDHSLSALWQRDGEDPEVRDMLEYKSLSSSLVVREGMSSLQGLGTNRLQLAYAWGTKLRLQLDYTNIDEPLVDALWRDGKYYALRRVNLERSVILGSSLSASTVLVDRSAFAWQMSSTFTARHHRDRGEVLGIPYQEQFASYTALWQNSLTFGAKWYFNLGLSYYGATREELYNMRPRWWVECALSRTLGAWRVSLQSNDLFGTNYSQGRYRVGGADIPFLRQRCNARIELGITYSWGKDRSKSSAPKEPKEMNKRLMPRRGITVSSLKPN